MSTDKLDPKELEALVGAMPFDDDDDFDDEKTTIGELSDFMGQDFSLELQTTKGTYNIHLSPFLMGRDERTHLPMQSRKVSRFHAVIYRSGKHYYVRDLSSTNGTYLNRIRINQSILRPGDHVQLGDWELNIAQGPAQAQSYQEECVVVFMDLQNSTRLTEQHGKEFTTAVQQAFSKVEDKLLIRQGCLLKHLGDGLMCAFGLWPVSMPTHYSPADQALAFAKEAVKAMASIKSFPGLHLRVGLHYGPVSLADKDDLDIFGDTVNVAARLEEANKAYQSYILMSDTFFKQLQKPSARLRQIDTVLVQGKVEPLTVFTWDPREIPEGVKRLYFQAMSYYRQGAFEAALPLFEQAMELKDPVAKQLHKRTQELIANPPEKTIWQGVWSLKKS